jgi:hypothetical protein
MFGTYYYHEKTRKAVAIFGRLFNNLYVIRKNASGAVISQIKLPLSYAPKSRYIDRLRENPDLATDEDVAIKLPRASFEISNISYDTTRQLSKLSNFSKPGPSNLITKRTKMYSPVPYNLGFTLNIYAKSHDDALQVVEQILPTFNPQYTVTIKPFADKYPNFVEDIPVIIQNVSFADDFDGSLQSRRTIIYTLEFEMKISYYGPLEAEGAIIREVNADLFFNTADLTDSDKRVERLSVTPDPLNVNPDSDYGFNTTIT